MHVEVDPNQVELQGGSEGGENPAGDGAGVDGDGPTNGHVDMPAGAPAGGSWASGGKLSFAMNGMHNIVMMDEGGNSANISTYDVYQSNGVINVIDTVLMPK